MSLVTRSNCNLRIKQLLWKVCYIYEENISANILKYATSRYILTKCGLKHRNKKVSEN